MLQPIRNQNFTVFSHKKEIIICAGRENNLRHLHPMVFYTGASSIMTGNYLTTKGRFLQDDMEMLEKLKLQAGDSQ